MILYHSVKVMMVVSAISLVSDELKRDFRLAYHRQLDIILVSAKVIESWTILTVIKVLMRVMLIINDQSSSKSVAILVALGFKLFFKNFKIDALTKMRVIPVSSSNVSIKDVLERAVGSDRALCNTTDTVHWVGPFLKEAMPVLI